jgi:hypothetical protein
MMNQSLLIAFAIILVILFTKSSFMLLVLIGAIVYFKYFRKQTMIEPYVPLPSYAPLPPKVQDVRICSSNQNRFCRDARPIHMNQQFVSTNQALAGPPLALTHEPPLIVAPICAWDFWSESQVVPSGINRETNYDAYRAGYITNDCPSKETFVFPHAPVADGETKKIWVNEKGTPGDMITCTYNPAQLVNSNIPSNLLAGPCMTQPEMKDYNARMFTTNLGPDVFNEIQVIEPIQSNMGISFQQQFPPVTKQTNPDGTTTYVSRDPRIILPKEEVPPEPVKATASNIYDPRSGGYGTSYRAYTDPMSGRTRYMYDDIDVVRNPNYVTRSNIDHNKWANAYGPMESHIHQNRALANAQFTEDTVNRREELQERYMRKVNSQVMWQRRMAPIHTRQNQSSSFKR